MEWNGMDFNVMFECNVFNSLQEPHRSIGRRILFAKTHPPGLHGCEQFGLRALGVAYLRHCVPELSWVWQVFEVFFCFLFFFGSFRKGFFRFWKGFKTQSRWIAWRLRPNTHLKLGIHFGRSWEIPSCDLLRSLRFCCFFAVELLLRIFAHGRRFFVMSGCPLMEKWKRPACFESCPLRPVWVSKELQSRLVWVSHKPP